MATTSSQAMDSGGSRYLRTAILKDLTAKCARNPRYSLRRYAQTLGVSHALLSLVLSGKRSPSKRFAVQTATLLNLDKTQILQFFPSMRADQFQEQIEPSVAQKILDDSFIHLSLEDYSLISDWYYYAILSLLEIRGAKWNSKWIAGRLGIPETQAHTAMSLLAQYKIVEKCANGSWKQATKPIKVENSSSTDVTRRAHHQLLEKASDSLDFDPVAVRDFSYCTFAMDESLVPFALVEVRKFRRSLMKKLESRGKANRVYELCVQLFPVSKKEEK